MAVLLADVKRDLSGLGKPAKPYPKTHERNDFKAIQDFHPQPSPVVFWDLFGNASHPLRATVSDKGPLLLSNMLELNDTQTGILYFCFKIADDNGWLLLDLIDLRGLLNWMSEHAKELKGEYGNITSSSIGAIQRGLSVLEEQSVEIFKGKPAINLSDLIASDFSGRGIINVLDVTKVMQTSPGLYANFLL